MRPGPGAASAPAPARPTASARPAARRRLFTKFPAAELTRLKREAGIHADPEELMSAILDVVPALIPPEKAVLFFPAPYNAGCGGTHAWMARARTLAGEKQASCGPEDRTTVVRGGVGLPTAASRPRPGQDMGFELGDLTQHGVGRVVTMRSVKGCSSTRPV